MNTQETRAYVNELIGPNGIGGISGEEMNTAIISILENLDAFANGRVSYMSITQARALIVAPVTPIYVTSNGGGTFLYDPTDTTSTDNTGVVLVTVGGHRLKRQGTERLTPKKFGAKGDRVTDDLIPLTNSLTYCAENNEPIFFDSGGYCFSAPISVTVADSSGIMTDGHSRFSLETAGQANVSLIYTGTTPGVTALRIVAAFGDNALNIGGFRLMPSTDNKGLRNSRGLVIGGGIANFNISNITVSFFDEGFHLLDAGEGTLKNITCEYNNRGFYAAPSTAGIAPNAIHFDTCHFNSNLHTGGQIENGHVNKYTALSCLANGSDATGRGLIINYGGYNGGVGLNMDGGYFEANLGYDIEVVTSAGGAHYFAGTSFNKVTSTAAVAHIKFTALDLVAGGPENVISFQACSFWSSPAYTPSVTRPVVVLGDENFYAGWQVIGRNYYANIVEKPSWAV